jgi:hypothetical protein
MAKKAKVKVNDKAFNLMTAVADKTNVDVLAKGKESSIKGIHNALLVAGMTPAYGNIADVADATLYALEGEFGEAAWSMSAAIPVIGQMVAGKRALKAAKKAGEEMVTLYRGVDKWHPGKMVKEGKFVGGGKYNKIGRGLRGSDISDKSIWVSKKQHISEEFAGANPWVDKKRTGPLLEFEVPKSYIDKFGEIDWRMDESSFLFQEGIPKEFLKKVHK